MANTPTMTAQSIAKLQSVKSNTYKCSCVYMDSQPYVYVYKNTHIYQM